MTLENQLKDGEYLKFRAKNKEVIENTDYNDEAYKIVLQNLDGNHSILHLVSGLK